MVQFPYFPLEGKATCSAPARAKPGDGSCTMKPHVPALMVQCAAKVPTPSLAKLQQSVSAIAVSTIDTFPDDLPSVATARSSSADGSPASEGGNDEIDGNDSEETMAPPSGDDLLDELRRHAAIAPTYAQRRLASYLAGVRARGEALARMGNSYAEKVILSQAGIPFEIFVGDAGVRSLLARYGCRFPIADHVLESRLLDKSGQSFTAFIEAQLDEMESRNVRVMRMHAGRDLPSSQWWADHMGVPRSLICNNGSLRGRLQRRLKAGSLKLGSVFHDTRKLTKAQLRDLRTMAEVVLVKHQREGCPLPSHPERSDKIYWDYIFDQAEIFDPHHRDMMSINAGLRKLVTRTIDLVGMTPRGVQNAAKSEPSFAAMLNPEGDAIGLVRQEYRRTHPQLQPEGIEERRHIANEISYLRRACLAAGLELNQTFPTEDGFDAFRDGGLTESTKGNAVYRASLERWRTVALALSRAGVFPATFHGAFAMAMDLQQMDAATLAAEIGAPRRLIYNWRSGRTPPMLTTEHFVIAAETVLNVPAGTFTSRLGELDARRAARDRTFITLPDGTEVRLSLWWRKLPCGAAGWPDEKLIPELVEAMERHGSKRSPAHLRAGAAQRNIWGLPEEDPTCTIWVEWEDLLKFKTLAAGDSRLQPVTLAWKTVGTIRNRRAVVSGFERWCRLPVEAGGLGLAPPDVSFRLVLNPDVVLRYVVWRSTRCADLVCEGEALGVQIAATETGILSFFNGLLEPDFGWLTQSEQELGIPQPILTTFRLPQLKVVKDSFEVVDDERCREVAVLSEEMVSRIATNWTDAAASSRRQIRLLNSNWQVSFKLMRDPKASILPIVQHGAPIAVMLRMIREALKRVRSLESSPKRHARDYLRIVAALLLTLVVFRSETLRDITWKSDNSGQLRWVEGAFRLTKKGESKWVDGHYEVVVPADGFKNLRSWVLFGPSWNRRAYERDLKDWGGLDGILKHYVEVCRPILLNGRSSDLLFPPPTARKGYPEKESWTEHDFHQLIKAFTRMWCVFNKRFGTGMIGVRAFGPHPFRDLVATHVLYHWPNEDRWDLAARLLGTGVDQVKSRYGWIDTRRELSAFDGMFDEASELAWSDAPLW